MPKQMQRKILNISLRDRIPKKELNSLSSKKEQQSWNGNGEDVARFHSEWWAHAGTMWDPCGKQRARMTKAKAGRPYMGKRGKRWPRRRWADILIAGAGKQWSRQKTRKITWDVKLYCKVMEQTKNVNLYLRKQVNLPIQGVRKFLLQTSRACRVDWVNNFLNRNPSPETHSFRAAGTRSSH